MSNVSPFYGAAPPANLVPQPPQYVPPTVVPGGGAGVGATATLAPGSLDGAGTIFLTEAGTPASGAKVSLSFGNTYQNPPLSVIVNLIQPAGGTIFGNLTISQIGSTGFSLSSTTAGTAGQLFGFSYIVVF